MESLRTEHCSCRRRRWKASASGWLFGRSVACSLSQRFVLLPHCTWFIADCTSGVLLSLSLSRLYTPLLLSLLSSFFFYFLKYISFHFFSFLWRRFNDLLRCPFNNRKGTFALLWRLKRHNHQQIRIAPVSLLQRVEASVRSKYKKKMYREKSRRRVISWIITLPLKMNSIRLFEKRDRKKTGDEPAIFSSL